MKERKFYFERFVSKQLLSNWIEYLPMEYWHNYFRITFWPFLEQKLWLNRWMKPESPISALTSPSKCANNNLWRCLESEMLVHKIFLIYPLIHSFVSEILVFSAIFEFPKFLKSWNIWYCTPLWALGVLPSISKNVTILVHIMTLGGHKVIAYSVITTTREVPECQKFVQALVEVVAVSVRQKARGRQ